MRSSASISMVFLWRVVTVSLLTSSFVFGAEESSSSSSKREVGKILIPVKHHKVTTQTLFAIQTSTTFPYCIAGAFNPNLCVKRRRRSRTGDSVIPNLKEDAVNEGPGFPIDSTIQDGTAISVVGGKSKNAGKLYSMVVWNTSSFTTSITVFFTNPATTLSLSILCIPPGGSLPPRCG